MHNSSGNTWPQSSQLAEPLLTDPGLKNGNKCAWANLHFKQKSAGGEWMVKHSPKLLESEEKATITTTIITTTTRRVLSDSVIWLCCGCILPVAVMFDKMTCYRWMSLNVNIDYVWFFWFFFLGGSILQCHVEFITDFALNIFQILLCWESFVHFVFKTSHFHNTCTYFQNCT